AGEIGQLKEVNSFIEGTNIHLLEILTLYTQIAYGLHYNLSGRADNSHTDIHRFMGLNVQINYIIGWIRKRRHHHRPGKFFTIAGQWKGRKTGSFQKNTRIQ